MNTSTTRELPHIEAALQYLEPMSGKPRSLEYEPPPGVSRTTAVYRDHTVTIHDVRPVASALSLEREGFQLVAAASSVRDFYDEDAIRTQYYPGSRGIAEEINRGIPGGVVFDPADSPPHSGRDRTELPEFRASPRAPCPQRLHHEVRPTTSPRST